MEEEEEFHRSRRMFCIINGNLFIAEQEISLSHREWFYRNGWEDFEKITRGYVSRMGDVLRRYNWIHNKLIVLFYININMKKCKYCWHKRGVCILWI